ncbi:MAG: hypothetical protein AAF519_07390 [Bacteroidota bacterium]
MDRSKGMLMAGLILLFSSCSKPTESNEKTEVSERELKALYDEVIDIHDEVMPKMDDIMKAKGTLQEKLDTLVEIDPENKAIPELKEVITDLAEADEAMMDWMRNFKPKDEGENHQLVLKYYEDEKVKISEVKDQMLSAIDNANRMIKSGPD